MTQFYEAMLLSDPDDPFQTIDEIEYVSLDALQEKFATNPTWSKALEEGSKFV